MVPVVAGAVLLPWFCLLFSIHGQGIHPESIAGHFLFHFGTFLLMSCQFCLLCYCPHPSCVSLIALPVAAMSLSGTLHRKETAFISSVTRWIIFSHPVYITMAFQVHSFTSTAPGCVSHLSFTAAQ